MDEKPFLKPEEFPLTDQDGKTHVYILSNFDAVAGRRIVSQYPMTGLPKVGDYAENEKLMLQLMSYVAAVTPDGRRLRLETEALVNNHVPDFEMLAKIEIAMMGKNCSFFRDGRSLNFCDTIMQEFAKKLLQTLTLSSPPLSEPEKPPLQS